MKPALLSIDLFLSEAGNRQAVILDARSESEFLHGHIPGAFSLPLLNDEHRRIVGTIYRHEGRQAAVLKGFELAGPLFHKLIDESIRIAGGKPVYVYCWRGGMRSNITAWLLQMAGLQVILLEGGYKSFRNYVLNEFEKARRVIVIGGKTGSGKTELLQYLSGDEHQVIDLEKLAGHKGSAYGALGLPAQPTQEHFENMLGLAFAGSDPDKILWLENESRQIGNVNLPGKIYDLIRNSPVIEIEIPESLRRERILNEYGNFPTDELSERTKRIGKRLGNQHLKSALDALQQNDLETWLDIVLHYYDRTYEFGNLQREPDSIRKIIAGECNYKEIAAQLKQLTSEYLGAD